ncbi:MAG: hypothetical protein OHK0024_09730 [Thalassobaculales bacterium]
MSTTFPTRRDPPTEEPVDILRRLEPMLVQVVEEQRRLGDEQRRLGDEIRRVEGKVDEVAAHVRKLDGDVMRIDAQLSARPTLWQLLTAIIGVYAAITALGTYLAGLLLRGL